MEARKTEIAMDQLTLLETEKKHPGKQQLTVSESWLRCENGGCFVSQVATFLYRFSTLVLYHTSPMSVGFHEAKFRQHY